MKRGLQFISVLLGTTFVAGAADSSSVQVSQGVPGVIFLQPITNRFFQNPGIFTNNVSAGLQGQFERDVELRFLQPTHPSLQNNLLVSPRQDNQLSSSGGSDIITGLNPPSAQFRASQGMSGLPSGGVFNDTGPGSSVPGAATNAVPGPATNAVPGPATNSVPGPATNAVPLPPGTGNPNPGQQLPGSSVPQTPGPATPNTPFTPPSGSGNPSMQTVPPGDTSSPNTPTGRRRISHEYNHFFSPADELYVLMIGSRQSTAPRVSDTPRMPRMEAPQLGQPPTATGRQAPASALTPSLPPPTTPNLGQPPTVPRLTPPDLAQPPRVPRLTPPDLGQPPTQTPLTPPNLGQPPTVPRLTPPANLRQPRVPPLAPPDLGQPPAPPPPPRRLMPLLLT